MLAGRNATCPLRGGTRGPAGRGVFLQVVEDVPILEEEQVGLGTQEDFPAPVAVHVQDGPEADALVAWAGTAVEVVGQQGKAGGDGIHQEDPGAGAAFQQAICEG